MKKSLLLIMILSLCILFACTNEKTQLLGKTQSLELFFVDANIENVDKVFIQDGSTGYSKTITKQEQIDDFLSLIKNIEYTPQENQEERSGFRYRIVIFDGEKEFGFTLNQINKIYYNSNPDIHPIVDNYYHQLEMIEQ